MADYRAALDRIEAEVERGNTDVGSQGLWKLVAEAKRDRGSASFAPQIGRIDRKAFEAWKSFLLPVWLGNLVAFVGTLVLLAMVPVAVRVADGTIGGEPRPGLAGILLVAAAGGLSASVHTLGHWFVGRWVGIRFTHYFVGGPLRITPGIKTDYATYLLTPAFRRASMHAAGALASKVAPFVAFGWAYGVHWDRGWDLFPAWSLWTVLAIGVGQIVTDVVWSTKKSDWKKVRRELAIAREVEERGIEEPAADREQVLGGGPSTGPDVR